mmetsp:Transcript_58913/g.137690  ORF Transcript_58913/g.137690 Transcript_58913/m.137690 type:complete len:363 (-) Transcript_58913:211-1299(-)
MLKQHKGVEDPDGPVTLVENTALKLLEEKKEQLAKAKAGDMAAIEDLANAAQAENAKVYNALVEHVHLLHKREAKLREQVAAAKAAPKPPATAAAEASSTSPDMEKLQKKVQDAHEAYLKTEQAAAMLEERLMKLESQKASAKSERAVAAPDSQADDYKRQFVQAQQNLSAMQARLADLEMASAEATRSLEATKTELFAQKAAATEATQKLEASQAELSAQKAAAEEAQSERAELKRQLAAAQAALEAAKNLPAAAAAVAPKQAPLSRQDYSGGVLAGKPIPKTRMPSARLLPTQGSPPQSAASSVRTPVRTGVPAVSPSSPSVVAGTHQPVTASNTVRALGTARIIQSPGGTNAPTSMRAA